MCAAGRRWGRRQRVLLWGVLLAAWEAAWGQLRYSVPEEMPKGSFIRVTVLDANDNAPVFSQAEYTVRVPEDVPVGSVLVTVTATDDDEGLNGHVKYSFKKIIDKESQIFLLDSETGAITLLRSLDFEEGDSFKLEVQAHDGGALFDTAKVVVTVTDVNDNAPELIVSSALSAISEDAPTGTVVALLHVQDQDSGANGEVRCSLDGGVPFRLEKSYESYYRVVTARELDREQESEYNVTVRAADGGRPSLQSSRVLCVRVLDVNDNAPVFLQERYSARLSENNVAGALVLRVRATDSDWGENARVRYRLGEGGVRGSALSSYVSVQAETGALYALRSFDYEEVREVGLWVWAEDGGSPALSSNVSVRLVIVDENDNAPQVLYPPAAGASGSGWAGVELAARSSEAGALVAKSHLRFSAASCCDTLPARPPPDEPAPLLGDQEPAGPKHENPAPLSGNGLGNIWSIDDVCLPVMKMKDWVASSDCAGRRLRAPLLPERSERKVGALQPRPLRPGSIAGSLDSWVGSRIAVCDCACGADPC
ncbi:protocadherin gamma-A5-like [Manacus vitellinus]|uniref:protocadherin gamma-A5-like n=1 Tax=Manacus vitellinus TaxID=328815 RepID=UPI00115DED7C|nr:protocadherin gamma-A5-like [Manacus vitellinus]